jgi:hypothetical protein
MPGRIRHRLSLAATEQREWAAERDDAVAVAVASGLGVRPLAWWRYSSRPDLAEGADLDVYAHLGALGRERAAERLRFLVSSGELAGAELIAVETGTTPAHEWRRHVLRQTTAVQ